MAATDPYPNNMNFPGSGVAGNVFGAVGGFLKGNNNQSFTRNAPPKVGMLTPPATAVRSPKRTGNTASESTGSRSTNGATARTGWGLLTGGWGGAAAPAASASPGMAHVGTNPGGWSRSEGGPRARAAKASTVSPSNQAAVDRSMAGPRSAESIKADPNNWGGIARDLGNAGSPGFAQYRTGGFASTKAKAYVAKSNLATASFEGPPGASSTPVLAAARPVTNPGGWSRSEGGPRARAAKATPLIGKGPR